MNKMSQHDLKVQIDHNKKKDKHDKHNQGV